jgi:uncharacterized protein with HEPN domain
MQPREPNYLRDMLNAAQLAQSFVQGITWEVFEQDFLSKI